ncbi:MAG TPA: patatin-like phospholipase family protein [Thermoanaerobaculia bacterium]|jgi:predicted acylesterase/phospholipase RssA|nr:patatin-like phospholipase family protein [Thermoanaerobaculia bacterium]
MKKKCDVVMKGGITSGIVYPGAVCELAKDFRFVNIGGTSAGAIAAALTAAAEYRRQEGSDAGFAELAALPRWLAGKDHGQSRLLGLFRAAPDTAAFFEVIVTYLETKNLRRTLFALLKQFNRFGGMMLAAAAIVIALLVFLADGIGAWMVVALTLIGALIGYVLAAAIEAVVHLVRVLPQQGFGISRGEALTQWLSGEIDKIAAIQGKPLTFGDLAKHGINLEVMTTNLTHGRPYRMPFETKAFSFMVEEMKLLFPESIVNWLTTHGRPMPDGRHRLPEPNDLPVVVAVRMSLSFPVLLSAVPLWSVDFGRARTEREAERCWFSDGGITSNFPVHFFDKPLPRWPTFAFNLAEWTDRYHVKGQSIHLPRTNKGGVLEWWTPIHSLVQFLGAIVTTMQNWRDNMLLRLPGQRDRIAHVLLEGDEGGLNLAMQEEMIARIAAKGASAAAVLRERYSDTPPPDAKLTWRNHKWVRFLALMPAIEEVLASWAEAFGDRTAPPSYDDLLSGAVPLPGYRNNTARMHATALALLRHVRQDYEGRPFGSVRKRPRPEPLLRPMPRE